MIVYNTIPNICLIRGFFQNETPIANKYVPVVVTYAVGAGAILWPNRRNLTL